MRDGRSFSLKARGLQGRSTASGLTSVAPNTYKPMPVALCFKYSLSSSFIEPSLVDWPTVIGVITRRFLISILLFRENFSNSLLMIR